MTFAAVGSLIDRANGSPFSLTPGGVGDLILIEVQNLDNNTVFCTALSSSNVTWTQMGTPFAGTVQGATMVLFAGKVTSTSAQTVTLTWGGSTPGNIRVVGQEFSSTTGAWALDQQGHLDSTGTNTWPSLTPAAAGELYFGYGYDSGTAVAGSTSGYTYVDTAGNNGVAFNPNCGAGATGPVWSDSGSIFGIMVLVKEIPNVVQFQGFAGATSGSFTNNVTIGNSIVLWVFGYNTNASAISSSAPLYNSAPVTGAVKLFEVQNPKPAGNNNIMYAAAWLLPNVQTSGKSVSFTLTNSNQDSNQGAQIAEVAGLGPFPVLDPGASPNPATNNSTGSANPSSGATGNITSASELIVGGFMTDNAVVGPGSPWTQNSPNSSFGSAGYQVVTSSGGSYTYGVTDTSSQWAAGVAAIMPGSAANVNGAVANVAVATPTPTAISSVSAPAPGVLVAAPTGQARSSSAFGAAASVIVAAPAGTITSATPGTSVNVEMFCWFQSYTSVTAQATMEFEAGQPVDTDVAFLTSDPWISMYPG